MGIVGTALEPVDRDVGTWIAIGVGLIGYSVAVFVTGLRVVRAARDARRISSETNGSPYRRPVATTGASAAAWWLRRSRFVALFAVVGFVVANGFLLGRFHLLHFFGTPVVAEVIANGDNAGDLISVDALYRAPGGRRFTLHDEVRSLYTTFAPGSGVPQITFVIVPAWPSLHQAGRTPRLTVWRAAALMSLLAAIAFAAAVARRRHVAMRAAST